MNETLVICSEKQVSNLMTFNGKKIPVI